MSKLIARPVRQATIAGAVALVLALALPLGGALAAGPADTMRGFYGTLLGTMHNARALGPSGRYATLAPVVHADFDVPFMARLAVGPGWATLNPAQQQRVVEAFERYIAATYAERFDGYSGEQLQVVGEQNSAGGPIVQTRIVKPGSAPITLNYLMRQHNGAWQVGDVYMNGTISELATRRSEFGSILARQGVDGLIFALNRKADMLSATYARAS